MVHNVALDEAYEIIRKAFEEKDSGQEEEVVETCNIRITHNRTEEK